VSNGRAVGIDLVAQFDDKSCGRAQPLGVENTFSRHARVERVWHVLFFGQSVLLVDLAEQSHASVPARHDIVRIF